MEIVMTGFGLASVKAEGTTEFYDFDGYDVSAEWERYRKLKARFWQTKRVRREAQETFDTIMAWEKENHRRDMNAAVA